LANLRVQVAPLAANGDKAAKWALGVINDVTGENPSASVPKVGKDFYLKK
jgi:hypothetical protein